MITNLLLSWGLTRDSWIWGWSRWVSFCALLLSGVVPLDQYIYPKLLIFLKGLAVLTVMLSGKYDSSPLPGKKP